MSIRTTSSSDAESTFFKLFRQAQEEVRAPADRPWDSSNFLKFKFKREYWNTGQNYVIIHCFTWVVLVAWISLEMYVGFTAKIDPVNQFLDIPKNGDYALLVIKAILFTIKLIFFGFRSYQISSHYYQLGYYRPNYMLPAYAELFILFAFLYMCAATTSLPFLYKKRQWILMSAVKMVGGVVLFLTVKYSYTRILKHNTTANLAPMAEGLLAEYPRLRTLKKRQVIPSKKYWKKSRVFNMFLYPSCFASYGCVCIIEAIKYLGEYMLEYSQTTDDVEIASMWGKVFILAFMCFIVWIAMFGWFWYENFVLKDVSVIYIGPWIVICLLLMGGIISKQDGAEWVMIPNLGIARIVRDALLGFGLCALAIRIVVSKEVMSVAPSKEEEDDFNYARTKYYRHVIGPRGAAIDRSSVPSWSISESESESKHDSEKYGAQSGSLDPEVRRHLDTQSFLATPESRLSSAGSYKSSKSSVSLRFSVNDNRPPPSQMSDRRSEAPSLSSRSSSVYYNAHSDVSTLRTLGQDRGSTKRAGGSPSSSLPRRHSPAGKNMGSSMNSPGNFLTADTIRKRNRSNSSRRSQNPDEVSDRDIDL